MNVRLLVGLFVQLFCAAAVTGSVHVSLEDQRVGEGSVSGRRTGRLYCRVGIGFHLQIHPNGRVNGSHEPNHLSVLELFAVSQGVIGIRGVFSNRFLAMNKRGWLHATDEELARQLVELGYRGSGSVLKREEFETRKAAAEASRLSMRSQQKTLASAGKELKDNFLRALAEREEANRSGKMTSIIFIRDRNSLGQEISGYIDYSHRLRSEDFEPYFSGKKRFLPKPTDLSFYNWETQVSVSNASANYQVIAENSTGLLFQNKRDRKILNVDPKASPGDNSSRSTIQSDLYIQVVIYDHITRMKV